MSFRLPPTPPACRWALAAWTAMLLCLPGPRVGFMLDSGRMMTAEDNGGRPVLVAPLAAGAAGCDPPFNPRPCNGRATYLRVDQSVQQDFADYVECRRRSLIHPPDD